MRHQESNQLMQPNNHQPLISSARRRSTVLDARGIQDLQRIINERDTQLYQDVQEILIHLAICHAVVIDKKTGKYNSSSPDETALVEGAKKLGFEYLGRDANEIMRVRLPTTEVLEFKLLNTLEFTSARKRMSVIVKDMKRDKVRLISKGADSIMASLLLNEPNNLRRLQQVSQHVDNFALEGLRTLILAEKTIPQDEYAKWSQKYVAAENTVRNRDREIEMVSAEIENELLVVGSTAIEDKLQEEVAETIVFAKQAGIKVWVLTGDKVETAINIGFSCGLLDQDMTYFTVDTKDINEITTQLQ